MKAASWLRSLGLLQRRCWCCGRLGEAQPDGAVLCSPCEEALPERLAGYCPLCGALFSDPSAQPHLCGDCLRQPPPWRRFAFYGAYEGLLRELILAYKFNNRLGLGALLSACMERGYAKFPADSGHDLMVPIPLHRRRLLQRGYNQSLELARRTAKKHKTPLQASVMSRTVDTKPQIGLSRLDRKANIKKAFFAKPEMVRGRRLVLVDDILTTGSTLEEATKTLLRAGAQSVDVLALCRTGRE